MARVVFELPLQFAFSTEVLIYIGHINHEIGRAHV